MKKLFFIFIGLMFLSLVGCTKKITGDEKTAEDFVKLQGYTITARKGEIYKYVLEKGKLYDGTETISYQQEWGVQTVEPDKYFGKEITIYGFIVKNHPLQKRDRNAKNGVIIYIMISEGKVIGGYSCPNAKVRGGCYSLLEEVTGLSYQQWKDN